MQEYENKSCRASVSLGTIRCVAASRWGLTDENPSWNILCPRTEGIVVFFAKTHCFAHFSNLYFYFPKKKAAVFSEETFFAFYSNVFRLTTIVLIFRIAKFCNQCKAKGGDF